MNSIVELWRWYNAVAEPLKEFRTQHEELGRRLGLSLYDTYQHLYNKLRDKGSKGDIETARNIAVGALLKLEDRDVICDIYESIFTILSDTEKARHQKVLARNVTNSNADVDARIQELSLIAERTKNQLIALNAYTERLKRRTWWQRLLNKGVVLK
jgi:hypothetical protein